MSTQRMPITLILALSFAARAWSQVSDTQPATQPADVTPITARVLEVRGDVRHAPLGSDNWQPCAVDDEYPQETVILTGIRSAIKLQIGTDDTLTAVLIESATRSVLSEAFTTTQAKRVRIGVGYGRVRAGVVEGGLKSDFTVDCPVATLSKRGTWDFGLFYERATNRFEVFVHDQGLVDVLDRMSRERRELEAGQAVTQAMRRWFDEAQLRFNIAIPDILGQSDVEVAFNSLQQSGLRVLDPQGGYSVIVDVTGPQARSDFSSLVRNALGPQPPNLPERTLREEGFFGTGRGDELIPVVIEKSSSLAERGHARPGTYHFRRSALESWLKHNGR